MFVKHEDKCKQVVCSYRTRKRKGRFVFIGQTSILSSKWNIFVYVSKILSKKNIYSFQRRQIDFSSLLATSPSMRRILKKCSFMYLSIEFVVIVNSIVAFFSLYLCMSVCSPGRKKLFSVVFLLSLSCSTFFSFLSLLVYVSMISFEVSFFYFTSAYWTKSLWQMKVKLKSMMNRCRWRELFLISDWWTIEQLVVHVYASEFSWSNRRMNSGNMSMFSSEEKIYVSCYCCVVDLTFCFLFCLEKFVCRREKENSAPEQHSRYWDGCLLFFCSFIHFIFKCPSSNESESERFFFSSIHIEVFYS